MPKAFREYDAQDWLHLRPLTQGLKSLRYDAEDRVYLRTPTPAGDLTPVLRSLHGRNSIVTIAFADPQAVDWQVRLTRSLVRHDVHLIADNSPDDGVAARIAAVARQQGAPYIRLPSTTPFASSRHGPHPSRSHGLALNWVWQNVLKPSAPEAFGFLDHDMFATASVDPFAHLDRNDVYGAVRTAGERWFLWAGYCFFRFAAVEQRRLDFRPDWFIGLDTGGGNWSPLYRHQDLARLDRPVWLERPLDPDEPDLLVQWVDHWLHEGGAGFALGPERRARKRAEVAKVLAPHLAGT